MVRVLIVAVSVVEIAACSPAPTSPRRCQTPLSGTEPFASRLTGVATFTADGGEVVKREDVSRDVYFPNGRTSGGRLIFSRPSGDYALALATTLDSELHATVPNFSVGESGWPSTFNGQSANTSAMISLSGQVVGPDDGLDATLVATILSGDVLLGTAQAKVMLCPSDEVIGPGTLRSASNRPFPLSVFSWAGNVPLDPETVPAHPVLVDGVPLAGDVGVTWTGLSFRPIQHLPPGVTPTVDLAGLRDVLGRPLTLLTELSPALATTAAVTDLTFETPPPVGATATTGAPVVVDGGTLTIDGKGAEYEALIALGDAGTASHATILLSASCGSIGTTPGMSAALVAADGRLTAIPLRCDDFPAEVVVPIPSPGPLWLAVLIPRDSCPYCQHTPMVVVERISFL